MSELIAGFIAGWIIGIVSVLAGMAFTRGAR